MLMHWMWPGFRDRWQEVAGRLVQFVPESTPRCDLNLHRIWLRVYATNARAIRVYAKAGLHQEGVMREAAWIDGAWVDEVLMASLTEELTN
jgi:RimJ/RimL family protein N-acetyltransferase